MSDRRLHEPLAPDEAELAQRLHVLPGGVPSAHVDAAILAAARAPRPRAPRSLWWLALSSAASLVLAVGLVWRMQPTLQPLDAPTAPSTPHPALREAASPASPDASAADAEARRERAASPPTATPESTADTLQRTQAEVETDAKATPPQSAAPTAANAPEAPKLPARIVVTGTRVVVPPPADANVEAARERQKANAAPPPVVFEDASPMAIEAPPPAPPAPMSQLRDVLVAPPAAPESAGADATLDAMLNQEIEAIRRLQREGRQDLARERLRELIDRHPQWTVPDDLRRLLE